jgi:hypothetical protein
LEQKVLYGMGDSAVASCSCGEGVAFRAGSMLGRATLPGCDGKSLVIGE